MPVPQRALLQKRAQPRGDGAFWDELMAMAAKLEPSIRTAVEELLWQLRRDLGGLPLESLIKSGAWDAAVQQVLDAAQTGAVRHAMQAAIIRAAELSAPALVRGVVAFDWNRYNPAVVDVVREVGGALIQSITQQTRSVIRLAIETGLAEGRNPRETARVVRTSIGLTDTQWKAVHRYQQELETGHRNALHRALRDRRFDGSVREAVLGNTPLTKEQIAQRVQRYTERYVKYRSEVIARTESINALNAGRHVAWLALVADPSNGLTAEEMVRRWVVAFDERTCKVCRQVPVLNPQGVGLTTPFQTPKGPVMNPTLHPQCRCVVMVQPRDSILT